LLDCTEAEGEALEENFYKVSCRYFASTRLTFNTWVLNEAELEDIGVTAKSTVCYFMERWVKSENILQWHIQMTDHTMRLLY